MAQPGHEFWRGSLAGVLPETVEVDELVSQPVLPGRELALWTNLAWQEAAEPILSLLTPFRDDACGRLVESLLSAVETLAANVELVVADDGSNDPALRGHLEDRMRQTNVPSALLVAPQPVGRSAIRNRLASVGRGEYVLFIDANMEIPGPEYLARYLVICESASASVVCGGYGATDAALDGADALTALEFRRDQCLPAAARQHRPWQYVWAGNLLVHRRIAVAFPFDESFRGWGWEDVEFGLRVARRFPIAHIDNPVLRTRLASAPEMCRHFEESIGNFDRLVRLHPRELQELQIFAVARTLSRVWGRTLLSRLARWLALTRRPRLWGALRLLALKLHRACLYADSLASARWLRAGGGSVGDSEAIDLEAR